MAENNRETATSGIELHIREIDASRVLRDICLEGDTHRDSRFQSQAYSFHRISDSVQQNQN